MIDFFEIYIILVLIAMRIWFFAYHVFLSLVSKSIFRLCLFSLPNFQYLFSFSLASWNKTIFLFNPVYEVFVTKSFTLVIYSIDLFVRNILYVYQFFIAVIHIVQLELKLIPISSFHKACGFIVGLKFISNYLFWLFWLNLAYWLFPCCFLSINKFIWLSFYLLVGRSIWKNTLKE